MTYGYYICAGINRNNIKAVEAEIALRLNPLSHEQKIKFWDKQTESLDSFEEDFEHFLATELRSKL